MAVKELLRRGVDKDDARFTPLIEACKDNPDIVEVLITAQVDVNKAGQWGYTALHRACLNGHHESTRLLIENAAEISEAE